MRLPVILAGTSVAVAHATGVSKAAFKTLVTFGDSYTDNGRLGYYINNGGKAPPAGQYHPTTNTTATGGLSWAQFAAQGAGANLLDYAVSGAVCNNKVVERDFAYIGRSFPAVLDDEIPSFKGDVAFKTLYPDRTAANTVYALWIGTNDLGFDAFLSDSQAPGKSISDFVECLWTVFDNIYKTGGRRFVLLNTAPLQLSPLYAHPSNGGTLDSQFWTTKSQYNITEYSYKMMEYTTNVNTILEYGVPFQAAIKSRWPKATVDLYDVHSLLVDIHSQPAKYLDAPANATGYYHHCPPSGSPCVDSTESASGFMWYDELHPSAKTSRFRPFEQLTPRFEADMGSRLHHRQELPRRRRWKVQVWVAVLESFGCNCAEYALKLDTCNMYSQTNNKLVE
jgi:phospholipase/lecithinase/hemolysin